MKRLFKSDTIFLLSFFLSVILLGTVLLLHPGAFPGSLPFIDALFTATSAVCVTGLVTINTADFTRLGQAVILLLIQTGGLGIISFTSLMLIMPGRRLSFRRLRTIKSFSISGVEHDPLKIIRSILFFTLTIEALGAAALYLFFSRLGMEDSIFSALFHSISAFCNAGFSLYPESFEKLNRNPGILLTLAILIVAGGIGFLVLHDFSRWLRGKKTKLSYHSKLIFNITLILIVLGAAAFLFLENNNTLSGMKPLDKGVNALFQSVTPRTAGFNSVLQSGLRQPSKYLTILLMFIGGAPGSIAGGIKISCAYIVLLVMLKRANNRGEINAFKKRVSPGTINSAVVYFIKAIFLIIFSVGILSFFETPRGMQISQLAFETVSAFGTVGLSLGITSSLSIPGKIVIICTMFMGRVGLIAFLFLGGSTEEEKFVYPEADILIG